MFSAGRKVLATVISIFNCILGGKKLRQWNMKKTVGEEMKKDEGEAERWEKRER